MPPPRSLLLPRPCQPLWGTTRVRWVSSGRDNNSPRGDRNQAQNEKQTLEKRIAPSTSPSFRYVSSPAGSRQSRMTPHRTAPQKTSDSSAGTSDYLSLAGGNSKTGLSHPPSNEAPSVAPVMPDQGQKEAGKGDRGARSLFEELFPEIADKPQSPPSEERVYPKLTLPPIHRVVGEFGPSRQQKPPNIRDRISEAFSARGEEISVLKLSNCSTQLSESDFRRLVPKGKHIESWVRGGEFYKVIPKRNPLTLERLPEYYLLFRSAEVALEFQRNAARLHHLASLHTPNSILSAIPPPTGLIEAGEDIDSILKKYTLAPRNLKLSLSMVLQPYHPWFRTMLERGGYKGVVDNGKYVPKVLLDIEGYEPTLNELQDIIYRDGYERGTQWPVRNGARGISRLRDVIKYKPKRESMYQDPRILKQNPDALHQDFDTPSGESAGDDKKISSAVVSKLYNRWIIEFDDEEMAKRFARVYHRRVLPEHPNDTWKATAVERMCNTEFLW